MVASAAPLSAQRSETSSLAVEHGLSSDVRETLVVISAPVPKFDGDRPTTTVLRAAGNVRHEVRVRLNARAAAGKILVRDVTGAFRALSVVEDVVLAESPAGKHDIQVEWRATVGGQRLSSDSFSYTLVPARAQYASAATAPVSASR
jgi:hypothetical protein